MDDEPLRRIAALLAEVSGIAALGRILALGLELLGMSGAGVAVIGDGQHRGSLATTGASAAEVDDLQFSLGEGPCITADRGTAPVLEPDLREAIHLWPAFVPAALELGVAGVFAFPLRIGGARLGVLTFHRDRVQDLDGSHFADALTVARVATQLVLELEDTVPSGSLPVQLAQVVDQRAPIHQATGMIAAQLGIDVAAALGRLRAHAWSRDLPIREVAADVVAHRLRFDDD